MLLPLDVRERNLCPFPLRSMYISTQNSMCSMACFFFFSKATVHPSLCTCAFRFWMMLNAAHGREPMTNHGSSRLILEIALLRSSLLEKSYPVSRSMDFPPTSPMRTAMAAIRGGEKSLSPPFCSALARESSGQCDSFLQSTQTPAV